MPNTGTYQEDLPCSGVLTVAVASWHIRYCFLGPDLRHNATFMTIQGVDVPKYIDALKRNWSQFLTLQSAIPDGGSFTKDGELKMTICIGAGRSGVGTYLNFNMIRDQAQLDKVVAGYEYAIRRAPSIQALLQSL